jgi:poly-gamma-glutamate capsule biosynthesis protein CapA/YwtB (metallophosphatase superfamily)
VWFQRPLLAGIRLKIGFFAFLFSFFLAFFSSEQVEIRVCGAPDLMELLPAIQRETGLSLKTDYLSHRAAYRLELTDNPPHAGTFVLGRIPRFVAVNVWNPVNCISQEQLETILDGQVTHWSALGGEAAEIRIIDGSGPEITRRLLEEPGAITRLYWHQLKPGCKVLPIGQKDRIWDMEDKGFSDWGWLTLKPQGDFFPWYDWIGMWQHYRISRYMRSFFAPERWLYVKRRVLLTATGDILFDRGVTDSVKESGEGYDYVFRSTQGLLRDADLTIVNLECPLSSRGQQINMFRGEPAAAEAMYRAGIDLVSLANNHVLDYGYPAFLETLEVLERNGLTPLGAGRNRCEACRARVETVNGIRIAFLAYTEIRPGFTYTRVPINWEAGQERPGVIGANTAQIRLDLANAKKLADFIVVFIHWGDEYKQEPNMFQRTLARIMVEDGANLVIGHHPHVVQGVEIYDSRVISYSLGNFVFDQKATQCREGLILQTLFDSTGIRQIRLIPTWSIREQPRLMEGAQAYWARRRLKGLSEKLVRLD